jgi:hypothetical protein
MAVTINIPSQVKTYANLAAFPASGSLKTIYIAEDTNKTYRWDGSTYVEISASAATGLTVGTTPISSGTNGRVLFQGTGNVLQQSSSLAYDDTTKAFSVIGNQNATTNISVVNTDTTNASSRARVSVTSGTIIGSMTSIIGNDFYLGTESAHNVNFTTAGTTRFNLINSTGNLNIGTLASDIGARLGVRGSGSTSATKTLLVRNLANTDLLTIWDDGAIGVNTSTNAGFRLDVNGTARINTLTIGLGGGQIASNTAIGVTALNANTTATQGVAIGFESLLFNTTGVQNTAVGALSLRANTTGQLNSAFGRSSLSSNTTSNQNTGFGAYTLLSNSTGANNTAMGVFALSNTTAGNNTAIGVAAGTNNTSGANNIFIGANATGVSNTESNRTWIGNSSTTSTWLAGNVLINTTTDAGFKLDVNGTARVQNGLTLTNFTNITSGNNYFGFETFRTIFGTTANTISGQYAFNIDDGGGSSTLTSGTTGRFQLSSRFAPTSGTAVYNSFLLNATINQTGGANGITRGLYINPTLTSAADFRAIETTAGRVIFGGLPTSSAGLPTGAIWNDAGTLKIV